MNLIGMIFGNGVKAKRCRRGFEKNWNRAYDPLIILYKWRHYKDKKLRGQYLKKKYSERG